MNILLLIPSKYEMIFCPSVYKYQKKNEHLYRFYLSDRIDILVGLTGIGKDNVVKFFGELNTEIKSEIDVVFSIGTCGICNSSTDINIGDCYITEKIKYKNKTYEMNNLFVMKYIPQKPYVYIGESITTDTFFNGVIHNVDSVVSVDMETYHIFEECIEKQFLNIRIVSDFCSLLEHSDRVTIKRKYINRYKDLIFEIIKNLKEI